MSSLTRSFKYLFDIDPTDTAPLPKWIGVNPGCKLSKSCPRKQDLGPEQVRLLEALQACDKQAVLNIDWSVIYPTLKLFEIMGLIIYPEEIVSGFQLEQYEIKLLPKRTCSCKLNPVVKVEEKLLNLLDLIESEDKLCDKITFPYEFDLNWDIKDLNTLYNEFRQLNVKEIDKVIWYLKKTYKVQFEELVNHRKQLLEEFLSIHEYLKEQGEI